MNKRLLLNLRHVPEDERDEVLALLSDHHIEHYVTPSGPFGISAGGIWVRDVEDVPRARAVFEDYQVKRTQRVSEERSLARAEGREETLLAYWARRPWTVLVMIILSLFILMVFFAPMIQLAKVQ